MSFVSTTPPYIGRFAPSPTGPLHAGSLVAAIASWLDARAHGGAWLLRIEDIDTPRVVPGADLHIVRQLSALGLVPDEAPIWQSVKLECYALALQTLLAQGQAYPCACSRRQIDQALAAAGLVPARHAERVYPGTCRHGLAGKTARAQRFLTLQADGQEQVVDWCDRRLGTQQQNVSRAVGDFVLQRADGLWAYQLAVVVDDAAQGITHVVRGEDLADNTARQILLQRALGLATPAYLHTPLVRGADGQKLSKQNGAAALDLHEPVLTVARAMQVLQMPHTADSVPALLAQAVPAWRARWLE
jgi:glutamyl-Q tRNA(Asp) synthetase